MTTATTKLKSLPNIPLPDVILIRRKKTKSLVSF